MSTAKESEYQYNGRLAAAQHTLGSELKNGDEQAFSRLIQACQRQLYALIWRILRNHEDTNDILQDTFLRLYQNVDKLHDDQPVLPYLRKIAINLSINKLKSTRRVLSLEQAFEVAEECKTDQQAEHNELLVFVQAAIKKLPREQQLVLILRVQEGLSYQEIAGALNLRVGTVMSRLSRAREKIYKTVRKRNKLQKSEMVQ